MKLNAAERIHVLGLLPAEGNFLTLKILKDLKEVLGFSEKDYKEMEIKQVGDQVMWNTKGTEEREIPIGEKATEMIVEALKKLDKEGKLTMNTFSLYEKFI